MMDVYFVQASSSMLLVSSRVEEFIVQLILKAIICAADFKRN